MLRLLAAGLLGSAVLVYGATLDFVRILQGPGSLETEWGIGSPAFPTAVATGPDGSIYVVGTVRSPTLPVTAGALQPNYVGGACGGTPSGLFGGLPAPCGDAFIARIAADGRILYATYLGGKYDDRANAIAVDAEGHAYVSGVATLEAAFGKLSGAFVLKLSPDGSRVEFIADRTGGSAIALAPDGGIVFAGRGEAEPVPLGKPAAAPLYRAQADDAAWLPANAGLPARAVNGLAAGSGGVLFAVVDGVFKSEDFGETWREIPTGLPATPSGAELPISITVDAANPRRVLVGTFGGGVLRSDDGGETWVTSNGGNSNSFGDQVLKLALAPSDPARVYLAGVQNNLLRSDDGGVSWSRITPPRTSRFVDHHDVPALEVDPQQRDVLYISLNGLDQVRTPEGGTSATSASAIFGSDDAGATWRLLRYSIGTPELTGALAIDPADHATLYAGTLAGVEVSHDRGATWTLSNPPELDAAAVQNRNVTALAADSAGAAVFAATPLGVFATADQGRSWTRFAARPALSFPVLVTAPGRPGVVFGAWHSYLLGPPLGGQATVSKLSPDGSAIEWSSSFGGSGGDAIGGLGVARDGSVWVTGTTGSLDFPLVKALQPVYPGGATSAFLARLDATGSSLAFSTYLGGGDTDEGRALAVDAAGGVYAAGLTFSQDFPTAAADQNQIGGDSDAFLVRLRSDESGYDFQTFLGSGQTDRGLAVAVDAAGRAIVAGETAPVDTPAGPPAGSTLQDIFLARLDRTGRKQTQLLLRGSSYEYFGGLAVDNAGRAVFAGFTYSSTLQAESDTGGFAIPATSGFVAALDFDRTAVRPELTSVENGASFLEGPIAPGEILTIRGRSLGPREGVLYSAGSQGRLDAELGGVRVSIAGLAATPLYVQEGQINVVAPFGLETGSRAEIVVESTAGRSEPVHRDVVEAAPGLFTLDATGIGPAAALDEALQPISPANPAPRESVVALYATGLGRTDPPLTDGELTPAEFPIPAPALPVEVRIGDSLAHIEWIGAAPTLPGGVVQINVRLPEELLPFDQHWVQLIVAGRQTKYGVTLAVQ